MLWSIVLALWDNTCWYMSDSYSWICFIYMLSTRARCPVCVNSQICRININIIYLFNYRQDSYCRCWGMYSTLSFSIWHPLYSMSPWFKLKIAINIRSNNFENYFFKSSMITDIAIDNFNIPLIFFREFRVHFI